MDTVSLLRQIACLLCCEPRNLVCQVQAVLECLAAAMSANATGVFWPDGSGKLQLHGVHPADFVITGDLLISIEGCTQPSVFHLGADNWHGLAAPMRIGGGILGRLWVLAPAGRLFDAVEHELIAIAASQLAMALENARLHHEMTQLAERRGELLRRMIATQDERCRRVSRELHDEISQSLTAMTLDLEEVQAAGWIADDRALKRLDNLRCRVLAALDEVNRIVLDLRPSLLEDLGLAPALRWYAAQRLETAGVNVHLQAEIAGHRLDPHIETTLYRIGQEALTNVALHAHATTVSVTIRHRRGWCELSVSDNGCGFDVAQMLSSPDCSVGVGLFGMKERAALVGGVCELHSTPGRGACVTVRVPVDEPELTNESHPRPAR